MRRQPEPGFARVDLLRGRVSERLQERNQTQSTMRSGKVPSAQVSIETGQLQPPSLWTGRGHPCPRHPVASHRRACRLMGYRGSGISKLPRTPANSHLVQPRLTKSHEFSGRPMRGNSRIEGTRPVRSGLPPPPSSRANLYREETRAGFPYSFRGFAEVGCNTRRAGSAERVALSVPVSDLDFRGERLRRRLPRGCSVYATVAADSRLGPSHSLLPQSRGGGVTSPGGVVVNQGLDLLDRLAKASPDHRAPEILDLDPAGPPVGIPRRGAGLGIDLTLLEMRQDRSRGLRRDVPCPLEEAERSRAHRAQEPIEVPGIEV